MTVLWRRHFCVSLENVNLFDLSKELEEIEWQITSAGAHERDDFNLKRQQLKLT